MKHAGKKPQLLSPAGSYEAFMAALANGADAIYLGVQDFNARAFAKNFDQDTLALCLREAHARGVKVYVTLNTLLYDREIKKALETAVTLWNMGVDALICADVGLIDCLRHVVHGQKIAIHASTQMSIHSTSGGLEISDLGCEQVVLAREVPERDMLSFVERVPSATVEVFAHGALCVCHSGQCLFSSLVGGRSGNRGTCAQPCRLPYNGGYPLSLKDLCLATHIPSLIESGVACLKIEGRMKSPDYVGGVTRIYRRLLDEGRGATKEELQELASIFSRDGFTDGYYTEHTARGMTGVRREEDKDQTRAREAEIDTLAKVPLTARCSIGRTGTTLTFTDPYGKQVTVTGEAPQEAKTQALTATSVAQRLCKLGNTPYEMTEDGCQVTVEEGLFLSPGAINDLRRRGVEALLDSRREVTLADIREISDFPPRRAFLNIPRTALFMRGEVWEALGEETTYFDISFVPLWQLADLAHTPQGVWLPPVIFDHEEGAVVSALKQAKASGVEWALCGNPAQVKLAREAGLRIMGDFRLNVTNTYTHNYWQAHGVEDMVLSPELTLPQIRDLGGRVIVYGRIPLMLTERCYATTCGPKGCGSACEKGATLKDRRGVEFPIIRVPDHRNLILNSVPTYVCDQRQTLPHGLCEHYIFTTEDTQECRRVMHLSKGGLPLDKPHRRLPK